MLFLSMGFNSNGNCGDDAIHVVGLSVDDDFGCPGYHQHPGDDSVGDRMAVGQQIHGAADQGSGEFPADGREFDLE